MSKLRDKKIIEYLHDYRFNSLLVRSFLIILIFLIVTFTAVMIAVSDEIRGIITDEVGNMSINALEKTKERVDAVMDEVVSISAHLSIDSDVRRLLVSDTGESPGHMQAVAIKQKMEMYTDVFDYIDSIYIYSHKNKYILTIEGGERIEEFQDLNWLNNLTEREYEPARMISRVKNDRYPNLITYIQPLRLTQMQFLGGIIINIDMEKLKSLIIPNIQDSRENLLIVDDRDYILFSYDWADLRKKLSKEEFYKDIDFESMQGYQIVKNKGEDYIVAVAMSERFSWKYISSVPLGAYDRYHDGIRIFFVVLCVCCVFLSVIAAFGISLYTYKPVKHILDLVKNPELYHALPEDGQKLKNDETQEIALNIIRNLYSNRQMKQKLQQYANVIDKAQLTALQAQISPHFLYNTLENIRWRAMDICKGDNEVSQIILNLSEMLRNSLDIEQQIITLEEEIHNAKLYIEILQLRYEDKIKVIWDIQQEALSCSIVKISLQPLVENAVYHGIKPLRYQGIITIRAYEKEKKLIVEVEDNGIGMEESECRELNENLTEKYILNEDHIGIRNVNQRLKLLLGDETKMQVISKKGEGTKVCLILPFQTFGKREQEEK